MNAIRQFFLRPYIYLVFVITGTALKFYRLDLKLYWFDEICTIQHTSGIPDGKYPALVPVNEIKNISYYQDLYHHNTQNYTIWSQLKGLFSGTNLTPLHYAFLIFWQRIAGDDYIHYRLFSVFIFIITLPFLYLLARTLFRSNLSGWIAVSLYSVSPFFHLFSQEARYYILWAFFLVILNYLLLKAVEFNKPKWWITYSITGILALYTSLFSGLIIFGHFVYVLILKKNLRVIYSISLVIILLGYLPWIYSMYINRQEIFQAMSWHIMDFKIPFWAPFVEQLLGFARIFLFYIDYSLLRDKIGGDSFVTVILIDLVLNILIFTLIISSFIYLFRKSRKEVIYFLVLITLPGIIFFYVSDLARNGITSIWWRYIIFINIGVLLVVVHLLYKKISLGKLLFAGVYAGLVFTCITSVLRMSKEKCWYTREDCDIAVEDAQIFSNARKPLLITTFSYDCGMGDFVVVLSECTSADIDILYASPDIKNVKEMLSDKEYSEIYVVHASDELVQNLKSQFGEKMDSLEYMRTLPMWQIKDY